MKKLGIVGCVRWNVVTHKSLEMEMMRYVVANAPYISFQKSNRIAIYCWSKKVDLPKVDAVVGLETLLAPERIIFLNLEQDGKIAL
ncbi:MAG: hypothetical protein V7L20_30165 [Nostoc sp.]|uniref:hypothetical protein n=1 Tax=Nostoc sp. TaxID=1180 RepID=UPI002FF6CAA7